MSRTPWRDRSYEPTDRFDSYPLHIRLLHSETMAQSQLPGLPGFDPENIQPWTVSVVVSMTILALVSVGLRLLSRHIKGQPLWWDDYMIVFSMVSDKEIDGMHASPALTP